MEPTAGIETRPWTQVSSDPNSADALDQRREAMSAIEVLAPIDRMEFICDLVRGKSVLDVGCVDHFEQASTRAGFLHRAVSAAARDCLGVDFDRDGVSALAAAGYDVEHADITDPAAVGVLRPRSPFDAIVIGEVIEHLQRPEAVMVLADKLLAPDGVLIVTTPNPYAPHRVAAGRRMTTWENVDHTSYLFPSAMVEMAQRHHLSVIACMTTGPRSWRYPSVMLAQWGAHRIRRLRRRSVPRDAHDVPLLDIVSLFALPRAQRRMLGETTIYVVARSGDVEHALERNASPLRRLSVDDDLVDHFSVHQ